MNEIEFFESIDVCLPYTDEKHWKALIKKGTKISDYEVFKTHHYSKETQ